MRDAVRPWTVALGCGASIALCGWDFVSTVVDDDLRSMPTFFAVLLALSTLPAIFAVAAWQRRNWGRIATIVISIVGASLLPISWLIERDLFADSPWSLVESAMYALVEVTIAALLLAPVSNAWYRTARTTA